MLRHNGRIIWLDVADTTQAFADIVVSDQTS
jgi:hypothetical protein